MDFQPVSQKEIINADYSNRIIVNAGPGTGKTYTLIERVKFLLKNEDIDPSGISILCFSRAAVSVVRERLEKASEHGEISRNWIDIDLRSLDSFATYLLLWAKSEEIISEKAEISHWDYDERIHRAVLLLNDYGKKKGIMAPYQHVFIDEIQDLVNDRVDFVMALLKNLIETNDKSGFTLFGDLCQAIYDYSAEQNKTSESLYKRLFGLQNFDSSTTYHFFELTENHRQTEELQTRLAPFRKSIMKGNPVACEKEQRDLLASIHKERIDFSNFKLFPSESVGILTRTNAEAIVISGWLKRGNTPHNLYCHTTKKFALGDWVGRIILSCYGASLSQGEFEQLFFKIYPEFSDQHVEKYWKSLIGDTESINDRYKISSLLRGILGKSKDLCLMDCIETKKSLISVSCIHQSKGLEYDSVVVLENIFQTKNEEELKFDGCEHKVHYVALTRPKSKLICTSMKEQHVHVLKKENRRCFTVQGTYHNGKKGKRLKRVEVGESCDINELTLAISQENQEYICKKLKPGDELFLKRCDIDSLNPEEKRILGSDGNEYGCCYKITPVANEDVTLGFTSNKFNEILVSILKQMWNLPFYIHINKSQLPSYLRDVHVQDIVTFAAPKSIVLEGAKSFDDMQIWQGFSMSGFALNYFK